MANKIVPCCLNQKRERERLGGLALCPTYMGSDCRDQFQFRNKERIWRAIHHGADNNHFFFMWNKSKKKSTIADMTMDMDQIRKDTPFVIELKQVINRKTRWWRMNGNEFVFLGQGELPETDEENPSVVFGSPGTDGASGCS
eukprot:126807-Rhodomonas_salina.2